MILLFLGTLIISSFLYFIQFELGRLRKAAEEKNGILKEILEEMKRDKNKYFIGGDFIEN